MGKPLILYGLTDLVNNSFEDTGAGLAGWSTAGSVNGVQSSLANGHFIGDGIPSLRHLYQNTLSGTAGNKSKVSQRFTPKNLPLILDAGLELAAVASFLAPKPLTLRNGTMTLTAWGNPGYNAAVPGSGTQYSHVSERSFMSGGPRWLLRCFACVPSSSVLGFDVTFTYDPSIAGYDPDGGAFWDRVLVGTLLDMDKGFRSIAYTVDGGHAVNEGGGAVEVVSLRQPSTQVDIELSNVYDDAELGEAFFQFTRWFASPYVGLLALWQDRDKLTNAERHFERLAHDPKLSIKYPEGWPRRNLSLRFIAATESV